MTREHGRYIFGSAVLAMLVLGAAASYIPAARPALVEAMDLDLAALLPEGAVVRAQVELPDDPQPARVAAYMAGEEEALALIAWDREAARYRVLATATYGAGERPLETTALSVDSIGPGAPIVVIARGPLGASTELVTVFVRDGDAFVPATKIDADGRPVPAQFAAGASVTHGSSVSFEDLDGDGDKDALAVEMVMVDGALTEERRTVFAWRDGAFRYDVELSRIATVQDSLFPEPEEAPDPRMLEE